MVPGRLAAKAATRDTKSNEACVKVSATLLMATAATLHVSEEDSLVGACNRVAAIDVA